MTLHAHIQSRGRAARAFSLIEVMIATAILGLGILGLLALFAGTARQQQVASQATDTLLVTRNAQALLGPDIGRLTDDDQDPLTGPLSMLMPDVWYPMTTINAGGTMNETRLAPAVAANASNTLFFLAERETIRPIYQGTVQDYMDGRTRSFGAGTDSANGQLAMKELKLPVGDLEPCSLRTIEIEIIEVDPITFEEDVNSTDSAVGTHTYSLVTVPGQESSFGADAYYTNTNGSHISPGLSMTGLCETELLTTVPVTGRDDQDYIKLNISAQENGVIRAEIEELNISAFFLSVTNPNALNLRIKSITVPSPYQVRNSQVISLKSRLIFSERDNERVPVLGYSLMFRRSGAGDTEVLIATYSLQQTQAGSVFMPREGFNDVFSGNLAQGEDSQGPLKRVPVVLGYDRIEERHYIEVSESSVEDYWVVDPGTIVVIQGDAAAGTFAGSEGSSRVVSQQRVAMTNALRGYLDRAPRDDRSILLTSLDVTLATDVWAIQPTVLSLDDSEWALQGISIEPVFLIEGN